MLGKMPVQITAGGEYTVFSLIVRYLVLDFIFSHFKIILFLCDEKQTLIQCPIFSPDWKSKRQGKQPVKVVITVVFCFCQFSPSLKNIFSSHAVVYHKPNL